VLVVVDVSAAPPVTIHKVYMPIVIRNVSSGMATITGRLVIDGVYPVYLAEVFEGGVFVLDLAWSPSVLPEADGYFIFKDIEPLEYVIIVGNPAQGRSWIITDDDKPDTAMVWVTVKGETLDVGTLVIDILEVEDSNVHEERIMGEQSLDVFFYQILNGEIK